VGLGAAAAAFPEWLPDAAASPAPVDLEKLIPADKKLSPEWVKSLFARGTPTVYRGKELDLIGMPVGGIGAGQLYLGGDGKLWYWDIFNRHVRTGAAHYAEPMKPSSPLDQGFAIRIAAGGKTQVRALDRTGFSDVSFRGEYPIATVEYQDAGAPVAVTLEAFSPFLPLNTDDSSLPATVMQFTVRNTSNTPVEATLMGTLENAVCLNHRGEVLGLQRNQIVAGNGFTFLECSVEKSNAPETPKQPDLVFEDWNKETYDGWTVEGTAFGSGPVKKSAIPGYRGGVGGDTERVANSLAAAPGNNTEEKANATGKLTSRAFKIERNFIAFWIGGGDHKDKTCLNLLVGGKIVHTATGKNNNKMSLQHFAVSQFKGQEAVIEIVDAQQGPWGSIGVGRITLSDHAAASEAIEELPDFGTMGLALLGAPAEQAGHDATATLGEKLVGELGRNLKLDAGQSATVTFVLTWHFPNLVCGYGVRDSGRFYATKFDSAAAVAKYIAENFARLETETRLWRDTWYDSTLPYWFLDRTFLNTSILATSTCYRFKNGRFYGWEGAGCCAGTCTSVWYYAQAVARLFPDLERSAREMQDFADGIGFDPASGGVYTRAEWRGGFVLDGQAGNVLRAYREHQMCPDDAFLKRNWAKTKKALDWLIRQDGNNDGIIDGRQSTTLDCGVWWGAMSWTSSLYLAALRAGEEMAKEMGDEELARSVRAITDAGAKNLVDRLWNGEYFIHKPDRSHPNSFIIGNGCHIDQVYGQAWAEQVGLGRVLPLKYTQSALRSIWKYNFTPDVGPFRQIFKEGRWFAMAGEGGTIMTTWPRGDREYPKIMEGGMATGVGYLNECWTGLEYQVAGHMIGEGMVQEGLAVTRAVHDRYHPSKRNPWNEVECGDHYARAMASYGVYLAACGYEYHGPKGHLGFAPRLAPEDFRAAFTAAEGWGTFHQKRDAAGLRAGLEVRWGRLRLRTLVLELPEGAKVAAVDVAAAGAPVRATHRAEDGRVTITLGDETVVSAGQSLEITIR